MGFFGNQDLNAYDTQLISVFLNFLGAYVY